MSKDGKHDESSGTRRMIGTNLVEQRDDLLLLLPLGNLGRISNLKEGTERTRSENRMGRSQRKRKRGDVDMETAGRKSGGEEV